MPKASQKSSSSASSSQSQILSKRTHDEIPLKRNYEDEEEEKKRQKPATEKSKNSNATTSSSKAKKVNTEKTGGPNPKIRQSEESESSSESSSESKDIHEKFEDGDERSTSKTKFSKKKEEKVSRKKYYDESGDDESSSSSSSEEKETVPKTKKEKSRSARDEKMKRKQMKKYLDDMAIESDSDSEEESEDDYHHGTHKREPIGLKQLPANRGRDQMRNLIDAGLKGIDELEQHLEARGNDDFVFEEQPTPSDPKLFRFAVGKRCEKLAVISLMNKFFVELSNPKKRVYIHSAFYLPNEVGSIYIEAMDKTHAIAACEGIRSINTTNAVHIPLSERRKLLEPPEEREDQNISAWDCGRIKQKGIYEGDFCIVEEVLKKNRVKVVLVPRLWPNTDGAGRSEEQLGESIEQKKKRLSEKRGGRRPPRRKLASEEMMFNLDSKKRNPDRFFHKRIAISMIDFNDSRPTHEDLVLFEEYDKNLKDRLRERKVQVKTFEPGDKVLINGSGAKDLQGVVVTVSGRNGKVHANNKDFQDQIWPFEHMQKFFEKGDHVEVVFGKHAGLTGTVTDIDEDFQVHILSDDSKMAIVKDVEDIKINKTMAGKPSELTKEFKRFDLVQLVDSVTVGMVVSVDRESLQIVDSDGNFRPISARQVMTQLRVRFLHAKNAIGQDVIHGATVNVRDGAYKGKRATVKGVYKETVFLFETSFKQTGGVFVEKAKNLIVLSTNACDSSARQIRQINPSMQDAYQRERERTGMENNSIRRSVNPKEQRKKMIGRVLRVIKGPYKGKEGYVKNTMGDKVSMQIITMNKLVAVPIENLNIDLNDRMLFKDGLKSGLKTPNPMSTPAHQSQFGMLTTPAYINTPAYNLTTPFVTTPSAQTPGPMMSPTRSPTHAYGFNF